MTVNFICTHCGTHILPGNSFTVCLSCSNYNTCSSCQSAGKYVPSHHSSHATYTIHIQLEFITIPGVLPEARKPFNLSFLPTTHPAPTNIPSRDRKPFKVSFSPPAHPEPTNSPMIAESYWGSLTTPHLEPSYTFTRLCDSIFHHFSSTSPTAMMDPHAVGTLYEAAGITGPQNYPQFWSLWMPASVDNNFTRVCNYFGYEYFVASNEQQGRPKIPVLTKAGLRHMLLDDILEIPDRAHKMFNTLFINVPDLVNPLTKKVFEHKTIPRSCFLKEGDKVSMEFNERFWEAFNSGREIPNPGTRRAVERERKMTNNAADEKKDEKSTWNEIIEGVTSLGMAEWPQSEEGLKPKRDQQVSGSENYDGDNEQLVDVDDWVEEEKEQDEHEEKERQEEELRRVEEQQRAEQLRRAQEQQREEQFKIKTDFGELLREQQLKIKAEAGELLRKYQEQSRKQKEEISEAIKRTSEEAKHRQRTQFQQYFATAQEQNQQLFSRTRASMQANRQNSRGWRYQG